MLVTKLIQSVKPIESTKTPGKKYYVVQVDGKEYLGFDSRLLNLVGQSAEVDLTDRDGKRYINFPKSPGSPAFQARKPFTGGKSEAELALTAKTMAASYAKDLVVAMVNSFSSRDDVEKNWLALFELIHGKLLTAPLAAKEEPTPPAPPPEPPPPKRDPNEFVTCDGSNPKLQGRKVSVKFCEKCFAKAKCNPMKQPSIPIVIKPEDLTREAFLKMVEKEIGRIGLEKVYAILTIFGFNSVSEVPREKEQEILSNLSTYEE